MTAWCPRHIAMQLKPVLGPVQLVFCSVGIIMSSFLALLAFLAVNLALIVIRFRMPELPRPFRVPFAIGRMPLLPLAAIAAICVLLANFGRDIYFIGMSLLFLSGLAYLMRTRLT